MLRNQIVVKRGLKGEAEKPFWISYADLMTALMVLFLVAMSVAMLAITNTAKQIEQKNADLQRTAEALRALQKTPEEIEIESQKNKREQEIGKLLDEVVKAASADQFNGNIKVDREQNIIDFGDKARYDSEQMALKSDQAHLLRAFVPKVLEIALDDLGRTWLKRVVVEGFASPDGTYLHNLNLSLQRSQWVICALLATPDTNEVPMSQSQLEQIMDLFLVGGYSFNAAKCKPSIQSGAKSCDESRRVEFRLEFFSIDESHSLIPTHPLTEPAQRSSFGKCEAGR